MFTTLSMIFNAIRLFGSKAWKAIPTPALYILGFLIVGWIVYHLGVRVGESNIRTQYELQRIQNEYKVQEERLLANEVAHAISRDLVQAYHNINEQKEYDNEETTKQAIGLKLQYANDSVPDTTVNTSGVTSGLSSTTKTVVVSVPYLWGFSPADRAFLIEEAARADHIDQQLRACKMTLEEIYQQHSKYQREMQAYQMRLRQVTR